MNRERLGGNNTNYDKPDWREKREREIKIRMDIGRTALGLVAAGGLILGALGKSAKTSDIMRDGEWEKNVKKIVVEQIAFRDGVNARKDPAIPTAESNQLASIGEEGEIVVVPYKGDAYYYNNKNDANGGWYGFETAQLSDELLGEGYISMTEASNLKSEDLAWLNEKYVSVVQPDEAS